jgi:hypothetical protein
MNKPILIFCHNYLVNDWDVIVKEQLLLLLETKLYQHSTEIHYCVFAHEDYSYRAFVNIVTQNDPLNKIKIIRHKENKYEHLTIQYLHKNINRYEDAYVLYYHTKGSTSINNFMKETYNDIPSNQLESTLKKLTSENITSWRKLLEYFTIEKWEECINNLSHSDIVGALYWINEKALKHKYFFSGNFWWSKSLYLKTLSEIDINGDRIESEMWVGSKPHKWINLYKSPTSNANHYCVYFNPQNYRK